MNKAPTCKGLKSSIQNLVICRPQRKTCTMWNSIDWIQSPMSFSQLSMQTAMPCRIHLWNQLRFRSAISATALQSKTARSCHLPQSGRIMIVLWPGQTKAQETLCISSRQKKKQAIKSMSRWQMERASCTRRNLKLPLNATAAMTYFSRWRSSTVRLNSTLNPVTPLVTARINWTKSNASISAAAGLSEEPQMIPWT